MVSTPTALHLEAAAFGDRPGRTDLPAARSAADFWLRAVALGGQGRYAAARADSIRARRAPGADATLESLTLSTDASLLRQLGGHARAAELDGAALARVSGVSAASAVGARCDALTGLAADALGLGRLSLSQRLLDRCAEVLCSSLLSDAGSWRQRIRLHWVRAELAMAQGVPERANTEADLGAELARQSPSVRHRVKSDLLVAAARCVAGDLVQSREIAAGVEKRCAEFGLLPLRWASAMLLDGIGGGDDAATIVHMSAREIERRGGRFHKPLLLPGDAEIGS